MRPAVKRPIRPTAFDVGIEVSAHGFRAQQFIDRALANLAVVVICAVEQDDHVLLGRVIANPLDEAATVNSGALEGVEGYWAAILDINGLRHGAAGKGCAEPRH